MKNRNNRTAYLVSDTAIVEAAEYIIDPKEYKIYELRIHLHKIKKCDGKGRRIINAMHCE